MEAAFMLANFGTRSAGGGIGGGYGEFDDDGVYVMHAYYI